MALNGVNFGALVGSNRINGLPQVQEYQGTGFVPSENGVIGTGEIISNYGAGGASEGAYKGVGGPVGRNFDTLRDLGIYGF